MVRVLLDTSFLISCAERKADWIDGIAQMATGRASFFVFDKTSQELARVAQKGGRKAAAAKLARAMLRAAKAKTLGAREGVGVDDSLVGACRGAWVATMDAPLARRVKRAGGTVVVVRQQKRIAIA